MKNLHFITLLLLLIGGLNWLLVGILGWDVGQLFGGQGALASRAVYVLVGLSAVYQMLTHRRDCKMCLPAM